MSSHARIIALIVMLVSITSLAQTGVSSSNSMCRQAGIDLVIIANTSYAFVAVGRECTINFTIENEGTADAPSTNLTIFLNGTEFKNITLPSLPAGNSTFYNMTYSPVSQCTLSFEAYVDIEGAIPETNEGNNYILSEFRAVAFSTLPSTENVGNSLSQVRAYNITDGASHMFGIEGCDQRLYVVNEHGIEVGNTSDDPIGLGYISVVGNGIYFAVISSASGTCECVLYADLYVDLEPLGCTLQYSTYLPIEGEPLSMNASVKNSGTMNTTELVYLELFQEGNPTHLKYHIFSGIQAGATRSVPWSGIVLPRGQNTLKMVADLPGRINESNEQNNIINSSVNIIPKIGFGKFETGIISTGASVYYAVLLDTNMHTFNLTGANGTDFDLYLLDPSGMEILSSIHGYPETISYAAPSAGWHYLRVASYVGSGTYNLTADLNYTPPTPPPASDFAINISSSVMTVLRGENATFEVHIDGLNDFMQNVTLACAFAEDYPELSSFSPSINDTELSPGEYAVITFDTSNMLEGKTYNFSLNGTSTNGTVREAGLSVVIAPLSSFTLSCAPANVSLYPGESSTVVVTVVSPSLYPENISIALSAHLYGLGTNITATFDNDVILPSEWQTSSNLTIMVGSNAYIGSHTIVVNATCQTPYGPVSSTLDVPIYVLHPPAPFALSVDPSQREATQSGGTVFFNVSSTFASSFSTSDSVALAFSVPNGLSCSANNSLLNRSYNMTRLTVIVASGLSEGSYNITIHGTFASGSETYSHNATAVVIISHPTGGSYTLDVGPRLRSITAGGSTTYSIVSISYYGFSSLVSLACSVSPQDESIQTTLLPTEIIPTPTGAVSSLYIVTSGTTPPGEYIITVHASGGGISMNSSVTLSVTANTNATAGIRLRAPGGKSGLAGNQVSYVFKVTNTGTTLDSFVLSGASSLRWTVRIGTVNSATDTLGNVFPNETRNVTVTVLIPPGAASGDVDTLTLTASSTLDPMYSVVSRVQTTVTTTGCCGMIYYTLAFPAFVVALIMVMGFVRGKKR